MNDLQSPYCHAHTCTHTEGHLKGGVQPFALLDECFAHEIGVFGLNGETQVLAMAEGKLLAMMPTEACTIQQLQASSLGEGLAANTGERGGLG